MLNTATEAKVGRVQITAGTDMEPIIGCASLDIQGLLGRD